jgi:hypothetical protein
MDCANIYVKSTWIYDNCLLQTPNWLQTERAFFCVASYGCGFFFFFLILFIYLFYCLFCFGLTYHNAYIKANTISYLLWMQLVCSDGRIGPSDNISPVYSLWATFLGLYIANFVVERSTGWYYFQLIIVTVIHFVCFLKTHYYNKNLMQW